MSFHVVLERTKETLKMLSEDGAGKWKIVKLGTGQSVVPTTCYRPAIQLLVNKL